MTVRAVLSRQLDRRAFLGGFGFAAGAVVASTLVPLSLVHAVPTDSLAMTPMPGEPEWNGHVDDACGHWPPYSYSIPYNVGRSPDGATVAAAHVAVDPIDLILIA
jgi:hypothetical protein